jgi:hypothetical protein
MKTVKTLLNYYPTVSRKLWTCQIGGRPARTGQNRWTALHGRAVRADFMDERFDAIPMAPWPADAGKDRRVKIFKTVRASDALQHAKPFWHCYFGSISAELETILDGVFTVAKNELPLRPIFQRNHPSWETD